MIVVDASAMVEALVGRDADGDLLDALAGDLHAPHLIDVEVLAAVRSLLLGGKLDGALAEQARLNHFSFAIERHDIAPLSDRIWALRHQFTAYDATYVALAEALGAPLFTCDGKLVSGAHSADVRVLPRSR